MREAPRICRHAIVLALWCNYLLFFRGFCPFRGVFRRRGGNHGANSQGWSFGQSEGSEVRLFCCQFFLWSAAAPAKVWYMLVRMR